MRRRDTSECRSASLIAGWRISVAQPAEMTAVSRSCCGLRPRIDMYRRRKRLAGSMLASSIGNRSVTAGSAIALMSVAILVAAALTSVSRAAVSRGTPVGDTSSAAAPLHDGLRASAILAAHQQEPDASVAIGGLRHRGPPREGRCQGRITNQLPKFRGHRACRQSSKRGRAARRFGGNRRQACRILLSADGEFGPARWHPRRSHRLTGFVSGCARFRARHADTKTVVSGDHHGAAEADALLDVAVGVGGLGEREGAVDDRAAAHRAPGARSPGRSRRTSAPAGATAPWRRTPW